jgi:ABC-2 type transport system permease protein
MGNLWTITWRELKTYFASPVAYVVSALFLVVNGYLFAFILLNGREASLRGVFSNTTFILLLLAPALTMRLLAEEQRMGTIELLLTAPVRDWQVVVGKFVGSLILFAVMLLGPTLYYVLILSVFGRPDYGPIITGYVGVLLLGASFLAVGVFASALTQNQIVAYFIGIAALILLWIADAGSSFAGSNFFGTALGYIAITRHYNDFFGGVISTTDVVYAFSVIAVSLFIATQLLQTRRWR